MHTHYPVTHFTCNCVSEALNILLARHSRSIRLADNASPVCQWRANVERTRGSFAKYSINTDGTSAKSVGHRVPRNKQSDDITCTHCKQDNFVENYLYL